MPPNPVQYAFSTWEPDATSADSNHPVTAIDLMSAGSANDAAGWVRLLESQMRRRASVGVQWSEWLGINTPYSPSPNPPAYISSTSFSLTGDWTTASAGFYPVIIKPKTRIKAYTNSDPAPIGVTGNVVSASFAAGITTVTVHWDSTGIDSTLSEVQIGLPASGVVWAYRSTDLSLPTPGPTSDNALAFTISANQVWQLEYRAYLGISVGSTSITVAPSVPAGATFVIGDTANQVYSTSSVTLGPFSAAASFAAFSVTVLASATSGVVNMAYSPNQNCTLKALSTMIATEIV